MILNISGSTDVGVRQQQPSFPVTSTGSITLSCCPRLSLIRTVARLASRPSRIEVPWTDASRPVPWLLSICPTWMPSLTAGVRLQWPSRENVLYPSFSALKYFSCDGWGSGIAPSALHEHFRALPCNQLGHWPKTICASRVRARKSSTRQSVDIYWSPRSSLTSSH